MQQRFEKELVAEKEKHAAELASLREEISVLKSCAALLGTISGVRAFEAIVTVLVHVDELQRPGLRGIAHASVDNALALDLEVPCLSFAQRAIGEVPSSRY